MQKRNVIIGRGSKRVARIEIRPAWIVVANCEGVVNAVGPVLSPLRIFSFVNDFQRIDEPGTTPRIPSGFRNTDMLGGSGKSVHDLSARHPIAGAPCNSDRQLAARRS